MRRCLWCAVVFGLTASPLNAQTIRQKLRDLFHFGTCQGRDTLVCLTVGLSDSAHGGHFNYDAGITLSNLINLLATGVQTSISNIPLASTSGGTVITFDQNGAPVANSGTTGPIFAERSQTMGRGRALFGLSVTGGSFTKVRGVSLSDLNSTLTHQDTQPCGPSYGNAQPPAPQPCGPSLTEPGNPTYENDTIHVHTDLSTSFSAFTAFATFGVTNRIDIGVAVPIVHFSFSGKSIAHIYNTSGATLHYFSFDSTTGSFKVEDTAASSGSATGIGDISLRLKANVAQSDRAGAALFVDVRLPTGNADDLLGTGYASVRALMILSGRYGQFSPHVNAGYLFQNGGDQTSAALGTVGFDALLVPRVTIAADLIGQLQVGANKLVVPPAVTFIDGSVVRRSSIPNQKDNDLGASAGVKVSLGSDFTLVGNAIVPLINGLLRAPVIWTAGIQKNL